MIKERIVACLMNHKHHTLREITGCIHKTSKTDLITANMTDTKTAIDELMREGYVVLKQQALSKAATDPEFNVSYFGTTKLFASNINEASEALYDVLKTMAPGLKAPKSYGATFLRMLEARGFTIIKRPS